MVYDIPKLFLTLQIIIHNKTINKSLIYYLRIQNFPFNKSIYKITTTT